MSLFRDFEEVKDSEINVSKEKDIIKPNTLNRGENNFHKKKNIFIKKKQKFKKKKNNFRRYKKKFNKNTKKKLYANVKKSKKGLIKPFNKWFKFSFGFGTSYSNIFKENNTTRESIKSSISLSPIKNIFMGITLMKTINKKHNQYYEPDFSYSFGYSDWHQDTFSLIYSNYADNKFSPKGEKGRFNFTSGNWDLSYKTKIKGISIFGNFQYSHKNRTKYFALKSGKKLGNLSFSAKYRRTLHINQDQLTLAAKGYVYKKFYVSTSIYLYSHADRQTSLEPDYAYSFGWRDSRKGKVSIMYSNYYTPTRFPWKKESGPTFDKGSISLSVRF